MLSNEKKGKGNKERLMIDFGYNLEPFGYDEQTKSHTKLLFVVDTNVTCFTN